jgi:hypothetical protein
VRVLDLEGGARAEFTAQALVAPPPRVFEGGEFDLLDGAPGAVAAGQFSVIGPTSPPSRLNRARFFRMP